MRTPDDEPVFDYEPSHDRPKRDFGQIIQIAVGYLLGLFMLGVGVTQILQLGPGSTIEQTVVAVLVIAGSLIVLWFAPAIVRWQHQED